MMMPTNVWMDARSCFIYSASGPVPGGKLSMLTVILLLVLQQCSNLSVPESLPQRNRDAKSWGSVSADQIN
jgi:hypothetical protein